MIKVSELLSNPDLVIIRGIPGSGKSTLARSMKDRVHFETDTFFEQDGVYKFDPTKIKQAHQWCQQQVYNALKAGKKVVVSNTFTQKWELQPYLDMCKELGKTYKVVEATGNYQNVHGVPPEALERMKARWEPFEE